MNEYKPDFNRLRKVLRRAGEPDRVPFYELFADAEIMQAVTGKELNLESLVEFHATLGYDYVPVGIPMNYQYRRKSDFNWTAFTGELNQLAGEANVEVFIG